MKRYTIDEAAKALGIDTVTLGRWLSGAHLAAFPDPDSHEYVLDQQQVDQLALQHGLQARAMPGDDRQQSQSLQQEGKISDVPTAHLQQGNRANPVPAPPPPPQNGTPAPGAGGSVPFVPPVPQQEVTGQLPPADGGARNRQAAQELDVVPEVPPIKLDAPVITIGRFPNNMVVLNNPQVSGYHARLEQALPFESADAQRSRGSGVADSHSQAPGGHRIVDLHSTNHVYVNSHRVRSQVLRQGDEISIGPYLFTSTGHQLGQAGDGFRIRIDALNLKQYGKWGANLLHDVSPAIPQHSVCALVAGSGVGSSTLL